MVKVTAALQRPRSYVPKLIVPNGGNFGGRKDSATSHATTANLHVGYHCGYLAIKNLFCIHKI